MIISKYHCRYVLQLGGVMSGVSQPHLTVYLQHSFTYQVANNGTINQTK